MLLHKYTLLVLCNSIFCKGNKMSRKRKKTLSSQKKWGDKPYYSMDFFCKNTFGEKVYKVAIDAGVTCPNRDGTIDTRGCIFCSEGGSGEFASKKNYLHNISSISAQISEGKTFFQSKKIGKLFIAYFQSYTNTYAPVSYLKDIFTQALLEPDIVGISIATRPDCLNHDVLTLLKTLNSNFPEKFIWIELGLQTMHSQTAHYIRRGYELCIFENAVASLHAINIPVIVHVILGLPGESREMMLQTCEYLNHFPIQGIKLQLLHVLKNTDLAIEYEKKHFDILSMMEYIDIIISCLEILNPEFIIHRLTGDGAKSLLIAPTWSLNKRNVLNTLLAEMKQRNTWQGKFFNQ